MYRFLADTTMLVHLAFVAGVIGAQLLILVGILLKWQWIRNPWFRWIHLAAIVFVAVEYLLDINCPLTDLEHYLRRQAGETVDDTAFLVQWLRSLMFFPPSYANLLGVIACAFAGLVVLTFIIAPPRFRRKKTAVEAASPEPAQ
jgi:hypothetical protein